MKFFIRKSAGRWSFGTADQSFVTFDTKERAIAHGREILRRIPGTELVVVDRQETGVESWMSSPQRDIFWHAR